MARFVIDAALREKLLADGDVLELTDENGKVVGRFTPTYDPSMYIIEGELASDEECARRARESRSYSAEEVMERLRSLRK